MKQRYKLTIEFDGTQYSGWQIQPNARTVEEEIENAFSRILQQPVDIIGQGRTDAGVHAEKQIAHVNLASEIKIDDLLYALRGVLPRDICIWKMEKVSSHFHARFDAKSRQYRYQIVTRPRPLLRSFSFFENNEIDIEVLKRCAEMSAGKHDFENFSKANKDQPDAVCTVLKSTVEQKGDLIIYRIRANRFVHHMVRRLVGTMLQAATERLDIKAFEELLNNPDTTRISTGITGKGLILEDVAY
ncbi:MAG TPA: tRNA pseudouridine(38-40) synthase TruA [Balneolaceae bacterium]|nr:tRNA pseudouridine(38-40) synthase TruA [Balneolaceae bacterium]